MKTEELAKMLIVTAEVVGHELSRNAAHAMALDLESYDGDALKHALTRCRRECKGRLTLAAVIERIDDGHPGADQAWALCPRSEADTVVWTDEIRQAFGVAEPLLAEGDRVAARLAFRDAYMALVQRSRDERRQAKWAVSLGHDPRGRERPVRDAVAAGRLPAEWAERLLPPTSAVPVRLIQSGTPAKIGECAQGVTRVLNQQTSGWSSHVRVALRNRQRP